MSIDDVAVCPSAVAVITTGPSTGALVTTAVDGPDAVTVARLELLELQAIFRPPRIFPAASRRVAASCLVAPPDIPVAPGSSVMVATRVFKVVTATDALPCLPSDVATISVLSTSAPVTIPSSLTAAIEGAVDVHDTGRPVRVRPAESFSMAEKVSDAPEEIV